MLALVSHEPHFTLLREVINFNSFGNKKVSSPATSYERPPTTHTRHPTPTSHAILQPCITRPYAVPSHFAYSAASLKT